ncbi:MAG: hypothetical protein LQ344_004696 [Seirophora lacunosa]|nr:MAG: hypothetical protein LQ344_004696 [Seirophora lacunosa]
MDDNHLVYLYHHIFLPAQVPQRSDTQSGHGDQVLVDALIESIARVTAANDPAHYQTWSIIHRALSAFKILHSKSSSLSRTSLKTAFQDAKHGGVIILHVALQNSGLIIQRRHGKYVIETFEASPPSADVLAAQGALEWDFPSGAVVIPTYTFEDNSFQETLASFLEQASVEPVKQYAATTLKAGSYAYESRDVPFPAIIGQLLMNILAAPGRKHVPNLTRKRVRDEVCWDDGAEKPWRRSATWLVLRVSIQRILCSFLGPYGSLHYKFFMCSLVSTLCEEFSTRDSFSSFQLAFARTKLARRVAKLEAQSQSHGPEVSAVFRALFDRSEARFTAVLNRLAKTLEDRGTQLRNGHVKKMYRLPKRADLESTKLSLKHSSDTLNSILTEVYFGRSQFPVDLPQSQSRETRYSTWVNTRNTVNLSVTDYHCLADMEMRLANDVEVAIGTERDRDLDSKIAALRQDLRLYQSRAYWAYRENVEQLSRMLLTLMEVWIALDTLTVRSCPLLKDYHHGFPPDLMYPLKVAKWSDMLRLQEIETYLYKRRSQATYPLSDLLGKPTKTCFAVRYFDTCEEMQLEADGIWKANHSAKAVKERELIDLSSRYEKLVREASEASCLFIEDDYDPLKRQHDDRHCRKHYLEREASRVRIKVHEDLLPADEVHAKAIVFELLLPSGFGAWRDSTWQLLMLARGDTMPDQKPQLLLREYVGLERHAQETESSITLASRTKSFYQTHYAFVPFPAQREQVCLPHGLKFGMYDIGRGLWTAKLLDKPSFATICSPGLSSRSAWVSLERYLHPTFNDVYPTSNEIIASQTVCPNNLTIAEYTLFQDIRLDTRMQWIKLLRELASPTINFGSIEMTTLLTELAFGAGPAADGDVLRATHWVFRNWSFCQQLVACVERRLQAIETNWREGQTVESLLVIVERLWCLAQTEEVLAEARKLVLYVRQVTHKWIQMLRREICNAVDVETAQKRSRESLHAALLCRKTFMLEAAGVDSGFQHAAFACFLECAFTINDNLSSSESDYITKMPTSLRRLYVNDLKLVHSLESRIRWSIQNLQSAVSEAVNCVWMDAEGASARKFSQWTMLPAPQDSWCNAKSLSSEGVLEQTVHFDIVLGTLKINGQLLGRLPEDFSRQVFFREIFGTRIFLTRPSYLQGMSCMFVSPVEDHEIHFGFRGRYSFMRVVHRSFGSPPLEFVPPSVFVDTHGKEVPDLPLPLIDGYVHWLDLRSRTVQVRPRAMMWRDRPGDWHINLDTGYCFRRNKSQLVDPRSVIFGRVAQLLEPFENRKKMIIYQPLNPRSNLTVDLPALELTFRVSFDGLLESPQLRAFVDMDQDPGTLYGLRSSLVLRDSVLLGNRSILVAMGPATIEKSGAHVKISIAHTGYYARFSINKVRATDSSRKRVSPQSARLFLWKPSKLIVDVLQMLGRLECAPEPRLLYFRAYCHAITSSVHPDPLTARTGTEEALSCLQAANAQPWAPIDSESQRYLFEIADLTPSRVYYPADMKVLQRVHWDDRVSSASQSDFFRPLVEKILRQCCLLQRFHLDSGESPVCKHSGDPHLHKRALLRAQAFQSAQRYSSEPSPPDIHYTPRDRSKMAGVRNSHEAAVLIWTWSRDIRVNRDLTARLQEWPLIQGYDAVFEAPLLSGLINIEPAFNWGSLFRLCHQEHGEHDKARLMFLFGTIAFGGQMDMTLTRSLIAVAVMDHSKDLILPRCTEFIRFRRNQVPSIDLLAQYIKPHRTPYPEDERALLAIRMHGKQRRKLELAQRLFEEASEADCKTLAQHLLSQWPKRDVTIEDLPPLSFLDVQGALASVRPEWERLSDNYELSRHLVEVQNLLKSCEASIYPEKQAEEDYGEELYPSWRCANVRPCIQDLLYRPLEELATTDGDVHSQADPGPTQWANRLRGIVSEVAAQPAPYGVLSGKPTNESPNLQAELREIIGHFSSSEDPVRRAYAALHQGSNQKSDASPVPSLRVDVSGLNEAICKLQEKIQESLDKIRQSMIAGYRWLELGGLLPVLTPVTLLHALRQGASSKGRRSIAADMFSYADSLVSLQQLVRVKDAHRQDDRLQLANEWHNVAHTGWKIEDHVDWLLLEIDFNLIIRQDQLQVAQAMIASPDTISNFVLQMNMGQGKSSVIIPMVATALAKDDNLVRVVVPRSLLLQAAQLLSSRLGGLINRQIKHVPFFRKTRTDLDTIKAYHTIHRGICECRGVLLALPEHLLSFQLSGLQELSNGHISEATYMIKLQAWFARKARDVLDECDHMLAVKTQLIYPSGAQSPVDGHPNRWRLVQKLLKLAKIHLHHLHREYPKSLEVISRMPGAFPTTYFLDQRVKDFFLERLTQSILQGDGGLLPVQECSRDELAFAADFLHHAQFAKSTASKVAQVFANKKDTRHHLLLLRGLLIHKILLMGLSKRWNVQYGIHPSRDPIAVPFRSKGMPSDQAEFGHPDVSIMLTCLSFYNTGLTLAQFQQSLGLLLKSDEPVREFESWIAEAESFPDSLRSWGSINVDDETQCIGLWNHLRLQMTVVNFFLNNFVFPRHAKTFDQKLVSSGWDIATPLRATKTVVEKRLQENEKPRSTAKRPVGGVPTALTVGFSGTNDNKTLLPLNVLQKDLPGLSHTNAEVLTYLLQPRNRRYIPACDFRGKRVSEVNFLWMLKTQGIRMLLDAGAQILELDNITLAKTWLTVDTEAEAAIFFGEDERARVIYRDGKVQPLAASPYLDNLGACVVYLDEAHTRGVDLKMPPYAVAALTLGVMQTKDHTVQGILQRIDFSDTWLTMIPSIAAMRLRQLAISQSIVFFAPPEVHQSLLNTRKEHRRGVLDSHDVIIWLLEQTCCNIEQLQPLYVSQGLEYCRRRVAARRFENTGYNPGDIKAYLEVLEQPEKYSLEELYAPDRKITAAPIDSSGSTEITRYLKRLGTVKREIRNTGDTVQALAHQEVEQEREVAIEVETIREVKKPRHAQACSQPPLHRDVRLFAETGRLAAGSHACIQAFVALRHTGIGRRLGISDHATRSELYITQDFSKTIVLGHSAPPRDEYSRPVHWVLWSILSSTALIITNYEANALVPLLRDASSPLVHLITYAAPINKAMIKSFDNLDFFSIPSLPPRWRAPAWLVRDLGLFAGRTYFDYDSQYSAVCEALGLPMPVSRSADLDREMPFGYQEDRGVGGAFSPSPLLFMQEWLAVRRKGQDFEQTMMGEVCQGRKVERPDETEGAKKEQGGRVEKKEGQGKGEQEVED